MFQLLKGTKLAISGYFFIRKGVLNDDGELFETMQNPFAARRAVPSWFFCSKSWSGGILYLAGRQWLVARELNCVEGSVNAF